MPKNNQYLEKFKNADEAEQGLMDMLANKAKIMGFGHRVYKDCDPRSDIIKAWSRKLGESKHSLLLYDVSERIEQVMRREKKLFPNFDFRVLIVIVKIRFFYILVKGYCYCTLYQYNNNNFKSSTVFDLLIYESTLVYYKREETSFQISSVPQQ